MKKKLVPKKKAAPRKTLSPKDAAIQILRRNLATERLAHRQALEEVETLKHKVARPFVWHTNDGRILELSEMDAGHLRNAISYVQRRLVNECGRAP